MKTCKDCYLFECCSTLNPEFKKYPRDYIETDLCAKQCTKFKDKRLIIEVPCTVGDIVYCDLDKTINPATKRKYGNAAENYPLEECVVMEIFMNKSDKEPLFTVVNYDIAEFTKFWQSEFGKYVFTKEQYQKLKPTKLSVRKAMKTDGLDI